MSRFTATDANEQTNWAVDYDEIAPIEIRDPVAEALAVLDPGDPFVVTYADAVKAAGHSCPTAAGAFRIAQTGLDALYPDEHPVRGDVEVFAGGPKEDATYGVMSRVISYITGASEVDGFGGLVGGHGGRKHTLTFGDFEATEPTFAFRRTDTNDAVEVTYHIGDVPDAGAATRYLPRLVEENATDDEREAFRNAWHARVQAVLTDDELFTVREADRAF